MTERADAPTPGRLRGAGRAALLVAGGLVALGVILYFVAGSSAFFQAVVLPRVGAALNADVTVSDAAVSPLRSVSLADLEVRQLGGDAILTARRVRVEYSPWSFLVGPIAVTELVVEAPVLTVAVYADGTSNVDAIGGTPEPTDEPAASGGGLPALDVKRFALTDATVRRVRHDESGVRDVLELSGLDLSVHDLAPGSAGRIEFTGTLVREAAARPSAPAGSLRAAIGGLFAFELLPDMHPATLRGDATFEVEDAAGSLADLGGLASTLEGEVTPTDVERLALQFTRAGAKLGEVRVGGPFALGRMEGRLAVEVRSLDRRVLNLVTAGSGMDFGTTTVDAKTDVELADGGRAIALRGAVEVARFQVTRLARTTPTLDAHCDFDVRVDDASESASFRVLDLVATRGREPLLAVELDEPIVVAWGEGDGGVGDASLDVALTGLNLADWTAFTGPAVSAGTASGNLKVTTSSGGTRVGLDLDGRVDGLSATFGDTPLRGVDVRLKARASAIGMKQLEIADFRADLAHRGQPALTASGSGTLDPASGDADLQVAARATLARLFAAVPRSDVEASAGSLGFEGRVTSSGEGRTVAGKLALASFTGRYGAFRFEDYGAATRLDASLDGDRIAVRELTGDVRAGNEPGGHLAASASYDTAKESGELSLKLTGFDPNGLRPFVASALGDKHLASVALSATAEAKVDPGGAGSIRADLEVTDLVVRDPAGALPSTPLEARADLDAAVSDGVAQIRRGRVALTPTDRGRNELSLTGRVNASDPDAIGGALDLTADSLDVTRYWDLFAGEPSADAQAAAPPAAPAAPGPEPAAVELPFRDFALGVKIGQLHLREVAASDLVATARIDGGHVVLDPMTLSLGGAPVRAKLDLDLGVPGYAYALTVDGRDVPLTPLVNSFQPDRPDEIHGVVTAELELQGTGVTGPSLRRNLSGRIDVDSRSLALEIGDVRNPLLDNAIRVVSVLPALLSDPAGAVGDFLAELTTGRSRSGFVAELTAAPIDSIRVRGRIAKGRFDVERADVKSPTFEVAATGAVTLADVLADSSVRLPMHVSLSRPLAERIGLAGGVPADQRMVAIPDFVKMKGSLGDPKADVDQLAVVALSARAGAGIVGRIGDVGGKAGAVLDAVGGLLGGKGAAPPAESDPSSGSETGTAPLPSLRDLFKKDKKGEKESAEEPPS